MNNDYPRIISYINIRLSYIYFSLRKDIVNHKDINCFSFFNNSDIFFMINVYSNNYQSALKYLKDTEANLYNILVIDGNFNNRDSDWNPSYPFHSIHRNTLINIADSFDFKLSFPIQQISTWYFNNTNNSNSVEINNYIIFSKL